MSTYNIIAASNESTVVAEYTPESARSDSFQSEAALEKEFIRLLCELVEEQGEGLKSSPCSYIYMPASGWNTALQLLSSASISASL